MLAESHYDRNGYLTNSVPGDQKYRGFTREVVDDCLLDGAGNPNLNRFWGSLTKMLTGIDAPDVSCTADAWNRIAYMNYIQCVVGKAGQSPKTADMWDTGEPALCDALHLLRPNRVLVLGSTNWTRIKLGNSTGRRIEAGRAHGTRRLVWWFPWNDGMREGAYGSWVYHPSARSPYPDSPEVMRRVLARLLSVSPGT